MSGNFFIYDSNYSEGIPKTDEKKLGWASSIHLLWITKFQIEKFRHKRKKKLEPKKYSKL